MSAYPVTGSARDTRAPAAAVPRHPSLHRSAQRSRRPTPDLISVIRVRALPTPRRSGPVGAGWYGRGPRGSRCGARPAEHGEAAPAAHSSVAAGHWHHLWGPSQITGSDFNHHTRCVSGTFAPDTARTDINFNCYNSGDGGKACVRLYNVESRKYIHHRQHRVPVLQQAGQCVVHHPLQRRVPGRPGSARRHRRRRAGTTPSTSRRTTTTIDRDGCSGRGGDRLAVQHGQGPALHRC